MNQSNKQLVHEQQAALHQQRANLAAALPGPVKPPTMVRAITAEHLCILRQLRALTTQ